MRELLLKECNEFYHGYINSAPEGDILSVLEDQNAAVRKIFLEISAEKADYRYAEGKWTIRELIAHVLDTERVFGFRAFWFSRNAESDQPGMDQDRFVDYCGADLRDIADMAEELFEIRQSHIRMFRGMNAEMMQRSGIASGVSFTVRTLPYIMAGHLQHHVNVLQEKYL